MFIVKRCRYTSRCRARPLPTSRRDERYLALGAALGKPVLASDYGLMGELVRQRSLGITVDSTQVSEITKGISAFLAGEPKEMFDSDSAAQFACENSAEAFARVVWGKLILSYSQLG